MRSVPWHVKGVDRDAQETAREAARRSGLSVGEWLNSVIHDQAAAAGVQNDPDPPSYRGDDYSTVNERLDDLSHQLDQIARNRQGTPPPDNAPTSHRIAEAILRLDKRLDQLVHEGRAATTELERRVNSVDRALANLADSRLQSSYVRAEPSYARAEPTSVDQAAAEIAARQRALDGEIVPPPLTGPLKYAPPNYREAQCGAEDAVAGLRKDLNEIGRILSEAMPRRAVEALEGEVRALAGRIDAGRQSGVDTAALAGLEQGLREVRDALQGLAPAESLVGFDRAVQTLSAKIDTIAAGQQDPMGLRGVEDAIASLRGMVGHVASNDALAALAQDVRTLADRIEGGGIPVGHHPDILMTLEQRLGHISEAIEAVRAEGGRPVSSNFDHLIHSLNDKLERIQLSRGDNVALGGLEDRIIKLVEKLDASEARLGHLGAIERGMAELLVHLEGLRANPPAARPADAPAPGHGPVNGERRMKESLEAVQGTVGDVVDRIAMIESNLRSDQRAAPPPAAAPQPDVPPPHAAPPPDLPPSPPPPPSPEPRAAPAKAIPKRTAAAPPVDPSLPHDHPLEPGSGPPRVRPAAHGGSRATASAAERVAVSEEPLRAAKGAAAAEPETKSGFLQAARRAAQYAAQNAKIVDTEVAADPQTVGPALSQKLKAIFVGISVAVLIAVALRFAANYFEFADLQLPDAPALAGRESPPPAPAPSNPGPRVEALPLAPNTIATAPNRVLPLESLPLAAPPSGLISNLPAAAVPPAPAAPALPAANTSIEVTGSVPNRPVARPTPAAPFTAAPLAPAPDPAPTSGLSKGLLAAANGGDADAAYEVATRHAEGRGVPRNLQEAAAWYERAAKGGLALAQFRLGSLYEKGNGVPKDLNEARRLYLAAAEKGNANAMHNIGVLYSEGIDGKPDFKTAVQWFRKAGNHGISDSQYNLAILYARGIGVDRNLTEAYRWFALAAKAGDADAAKKRDDIAGRLDQQSLALARKAVETWSAEPQPEQATTVKSPPGGWDQAEPAPTKPKTRPRVQARPAAAPL